VEPDLPVPRATPYAAAPYRQMPFVQVGAPGIEVLRSPETLKRLLIAQSRATPDTLNNCDVWNYDFAEATGIAGPTLSPECYASADRSHPVSFEHYFAWLQRQR
jgi:hypothetical protein